MKVGGFSGTVDRDGLGRCNGVIFVTRDKDKNSRARNKHKSGWWECPYTNLNGIMKERNNTDDRDHVHWYKFIEDRGYEALYKTRMTLILKKTTPCIYE